MNFFETNKTNVNLTGNQIATLFDSVANQILYSLNLFTGVLEANMVHVLSWVSINRRKKISPIPRDLQLQYLYSFAATQDVDDRYAILHKMKLDRFYVRKMADTFIKKSEDYRLLYRKYMGGTPTDEDLLRMSELEDACKCSRLYLYPLLLNLEEYLLLYKALSDLVMSKYYKYLWTLVKKRVYATTRHFDETEMYQNYISAALKALDRYDPEKGALTSYIAQWIQNNQQSAPESPEYGVAYDLPASQIQKQVRSDSEHLNIATEDNFSVSLDALLEEGELSEHTSGAYAYSPDKIKEEDDKQQLLLCLAKYADPLGIARLALGIQEHHGPDVLRKMVESMRADGLVERVERD